MWGKRREKKKAKEQKTQGKKVCKQMKEWEGKERKRQKDKVEMRKKEE